MPLNLRTTDELYTWMECPYRWRARYHACAVTLDDAVAWAMDVLAVTVLRWYVDGREPAWEHVEQRLAPIDPKGARLAALRALCASWRDDILAHHPSRPGISGAVRIPGGKAGSSCRVPFTVIAFLDDEAVCYVPRRTMDARADFWVPAVILALARTPTLLGEECPDTGTFISPTFEVPHSTINERGTAAGMPAKDPEKHTDRETLERACLDTGADLEEYETILEQLPGRWQLVADGASCELEEEWSRQRLYSDLRPIVAGVKGSIRTSNAPRHPGAHCQTCPYVVQCNSETSTSSRPQRQWPGAYILPQKDFTWETWGKAAEALSATPDG